MTPYAKSSAHNLCEEYRMMFINYKKYGNVVLDVELKDEPKIREIFLSSETLRDYEENIKKFWVKDNQIVISVCSDIEKSYDSDMSGTDIPVITDFSESDLIRYNAVVSEDFFNRLCGNTANTEKFLAYVETDNFIYTLEIYNQKKNRFIKIYNERISKDSIVTD